MRTFDMALADAYAAKKVDLTVAREFSVNLDEFNRLVARSI